MPTKPKKTASKTPLTLFPRPPSPPKKTKPKRAKSLNPPAVSAAAASTTLVKSKKKAVPADQKPAPAPARPPKQPELSTEQEVDVEETSQMWLLRHLRFKLEDIDDAILTDFIHQQDVTPFRDFMMNFSGERRCLFVLVCRNQPQLIGIPSSFFNFPEFDPEPAPTVPNTQRTEMSVPTQLAVPPPEEPKKPIRLMKPKRKKSKKKKDLTATAAKQKDDSEQVRRIQQKAKEELIEEIVNQELLSENPEIQLKWSTARKIPDEAEFVFILSRSEDRLSEKSELDQGFYVGHVKNGQVFKKVIEIGRLVIGQKMTFERQMDMVLYGIHAQQQVSSTFQREKWQQKHERFENFITDVIGSAYWQSTNGVNRSESILSLTDQRSAVESVESLLKPRIFAFVKDPNAKTRIQLWLELSLYQLKFVHPDDSAEEMEDKMVRILTVLQTLNLLVSESHLAKEWLQKALFYTIELVARLLGNNLKGEIEALTADLFEDLDLAGLGACLVRDKLRPVFGKMLDMGTLSLYPANSEEFGLVENVRQCLKIFEYIEEEVEKMKLHVDYLKSPQHDMLVDRSPLDEACEILRSTMVLFQETYFESALESGNIETMKTVCLKVSSQQERLKEIVQDLSSN